MLKMTGSWPALTCTWARPLVLDPKNPPYIWISTQKLIHPKGAYTKLRICTPCKYSLNSVTTWKRYHRRPLFEPYMPTNSPEPVLPTGLSTCLPAPLPYGCLHGRISSSKSWSIMVQFGVPFSARIIHFSLSTKLSPHHSYSWHYAISLAALLKLFLEPFVRLIFWLGNFTKIIPMQEHTQAQKILRTKRLQWLLPCRTKTERTLLLLHLINSLLILELFSPFPICIIIIFRVLTIHLTHMLYIMH